MKSKYLIQKYSLLIIFAIIIISGCKKEVPYEWPVYIGVPFIEAPIITDIGLTTVTLKEIYLWDGNDSITAKGFCWNTEEVWSLSSNSTNNGPGKSLFSSTITGLSSGTKYFVWAYATNGFGTKLSKSTSFSTLPVVPVLTTAPVINCTTSSAYLGGEISSEGLTNVTERGIIWSSSSDLLTTANKVPVGSGPGAFSTEITALAPSTSYYFKAYAKNANGITYGKQLTFTTRTGTISDIEGNIYYTQAIGFQIWITENLRATKYNDGTPIPLITDNAAWCGAVTPAYCWYNNDENGYKKDWGALYNWYTVKTGKICPAGWHVPTTIDWNALKDYLINNKYNIPSNSANIAKSLASRWGWAIYSHANYAQMAPQEGEIRTDLTANNSSGFTALPGGYRSKDDGVFSSVGYSGYWWSSTQMDDLTAWYYRLDYISYSIYQYSKSDKDGLSVRCLKNQ